MSIRHRMDTGEGRLPPTGRLVRDPGRAIFIESWRARPEEEARIDADLIARWPEDARGGWIAYGVAYRVG